MPKHLARQPRHAAISTALLLAGSLLLSACAALLEQPDGGRTAAPSTAQAADGPQTAAWPMH